MLYNSKAASFSNVVRGVHPPRAATVSGSENDPRKTYSGFLDVLTSFAGGFVVGASGAGG